MSIDTEGTEFKIINKFDFEKYSVGIICVEHNFTEKTRNSMHELLVRNNFARTFVEYSHFDDWYINKKLTLNEQFQQHNEIWKVENLNDFEK